MTAAYPNTARAAFDEAVARLDEINASYTARAAAAEVEYLANGDQDQLVRVNGIKYLIVCYLDRWTGKYVWYIKRFDDDALLDAGMSPSQQEGFDKALFRARAAQIDAELRTATKQMCDALEVLLSGDDDTE